MNNNEAIEILKKDIDHWKKIIQRFERDSYWYNEGVKKIKALKVAVEAIRDLEKLEKNCIVCGDDYWSDRYEITEKIWADDFGVPRAKSFCITPIESTVVTNNDNVLSMIEGS